MNRQALELEIEKALKSKGRLSLLADCARILQLRLVEQQANRDLPPGEIITDIDRGRALWYILKEAINRLKPAATAPDLTPEWRLYRITSEVYVQGRTHDEVARSLGLPPRSYDRERRAAIEAIAKIIGQLEESTP